jgi:hypothetical protein
MPDGQSSSPSRLSIFVLDRVSGAPVANLPVYVEVLWGGSPRALVGADGCEIDGETG